MKSRYLLISIMIFLFIPSIFAQETNQTISKCDCTECHQFDFWIGKWKVAWENTDGSRSEGTNTVNLILDGCVIEENFDGNPAMPFRGKSVSAYNKNEKVWQQTWVDNSGAYLLFTGVMEDDKMILSRTMETSNGTVIQRMVFYNITKDSFEWNWESSTDNGSNWILNWKINYSRI